MDSGRRITLQEAADRLNVHYMTAYRYIHTGRLPARQEGMRWTVAVSDLDALQQGGRRKRGAARSATQAQLMDRLVAGDEPGSWAVINAALTSGMRARERPSRSGCRGPAHHRGALGLRRALSGR